MNTDLVVVWSGATWRDIPIPSDVQGQRQQQASGSLCLRQPVLTTRPTPERDRIVRVLLLAGKPLTVPQISRALLKQTNHTRNLLRKMARDGVIVASAAQRTQRLGRRPHQYRVTEP